MCIILLAQCVVHSCKLKDDHRMGYWGGLTQSSEGEALRSRLWDHQIGLTQPSGWFTCLDNFLQATREKNTKQNNQKSACGALDLIASWQVEQQTHRQALTLQPQTDGSWLCPDNAIWFHMVRYSASAQWRRGGSSHDMTERRRDHRREKEREGKQ